MARSGRAALPRRGWPAARGKMLVQVAFIAFPVVSSTTTRRGTSEPVQHAGLTLVSPSSGRGGQRGVARDNCEVWEPAGTGACGCCGGCMGTWARCTLGGGAGGCAGEPSCRGHLCGSAPGCHAGQVQLVRRLLPRPAQPVPHLDQGQPELRRGADPVPAVVQRQEIAGRASTIRGAPFIRCDRCCSATSAGLAMSRPSVPSLPGVGKPTQVPRAFFTTSTASRRGP